MVLGVAGGVVAGEGTPAASSKRRTAAVRSVMTSFQPKTGFGKPLLAR